MWFRPATKKDALKLFNWKNDKDVRKFSIVTSSIIKWDKHLEWLKENLQYIEIIVEDGIDVGDIRIKDNEVAIKIVSEFRGRGLGKKVIDFVKEEGLTAKIVKGNEPSMKLFLGEGFKVKNFKKGVYTLQYE